MRCVHRTIAVLAGVFTLLSGLIGSATASHPSNYYAPGSFFYSRADTLPVDSARTTSFQQFMASHPDQRAITWPKLNVNANWATSYDYGTSADPVWMLRTPAEASYTGRLAILSTQGFHMADSVASTIPTGTQDRPVVVIDTVFGYTVQFSDAVADLSTHTIKGTGPGIMWHGSNALDYRNPRSTDARNQSSRGRIIDAMVITREELDHAVAAGTGVGHVLHLFFVETNTTEGFVHPMVGTESGEYGWGAEGERIRLSDAGLQRALNAGLTGHALAVARTLNDHGAYLGDNSGSPTQIKMSQLSKYQGTNITTDALKGKVFWSDFEVVLKGAQ